MVEREPGLAPPIPPEPVAKETPRRRRGGFWIFVLGFILGAAALFALALFASLQSL